MEEVKEGGKELSPIVFLDVDGVLCLAGKGLYALPGKRTFDETALNQLKNIINKSGAKVFKLRFLLIKS